MVIFGVATGTGKVACWLEAVQPLWQAAGASHHSTDLLWVKRGPVRGKGTCAWLVLVITQQGTVFDNMDD